MVREGVGEEVGAALGAVRVDDAWTLGADGEGEAANGDDGEAGEAGAGENGAAPLAERSPLKAAPAGSDDGPFEQPARTTAPTVSTQIGRRLYQVTSRPFSHDHPT